MGEQSTAATLQNGAPPTVATSHEEKFEGIALRIRAKRFAQRKEDFEQQLNIDDLKNELAHIDQKGRRYIEGYCDGVEDGRRPASDVCKTLFYYLARQHNIKLSFAEQRRADEYVHLALGADESRIEILDKEFEALPAPGTPQKPGMPTHAK